MTPPFPLPATLSCPANCGLDEALRCWLRHRLGLIADLASATARGNDHDSEVLRVDLRNVERRIDSMLALGVARQRRTA